MLHAATRTEPFTKIVLLFYLILDFRCEQLLQRVFKLRGSRSAQGRSIHKKRTS